MAPGAVSQRPLWDRHGCSSDPPSPHLPPDPSAHSPPHGGHTFFFLKHFYFFQPRNITIYEDKRERGGGDVAWG